MMSTGFILKLMPILNARRLTLNAKRGFTLIELLVVITIIGILATFIVASFSSAQAKSRDSRRKSDMDALKKALELAKGDSSNGAFYPGCTATNECLITTVALQPVITPAYIKAVPADPKGFAAACNAADHGYCYNAGCFTSYCASTYTLRACLENASEAVAGNTVAVAVGVCTSLREYRVSNP